MLIYAGTTEGRLLAQELSRAHIACDVHVATEYGQMVMPELAGVKVCVGRLDVEEMRALLKKNGQNNYAAVVDATHPFATEVSANIRESTKGSGIPYLRLKRRMDDGICTQTTTFAPLSRNDCATVLPMPDAPPVTTAVFPSRFNHEVMNISPIFSYHTISE